MLSEEGIQQLIIELDEKLTTNITPDVKLPDLPSNREDFKNLINQLPFVLCIQLYSVLHHRNELAHIDVYRNILNERMGIDSKYTHGTPEHRMIFDGQVMKHLQMLGNNKVIQYNKNKDYIPYSSPFRGELTLVDENDYPEAVFIALGLIFKTKEAIKKYEDQGTLPTFLKDTGYKIFCWAAFSGNIQVFKALFDALEDKEDCDGKSILYAAYSQNEKMVRYIYGILKEFDATHHFDLRRLLECACEGGDLGVVKAVCELSHLPSADTRTEEENNDIKKVTIRQCIRNGHVNVLEYFYDIKKCPPIYSARDARAILWDIENAVTHYHAKTLDIALTSMSSEIKASIFGEKLNNEEQFRGFDIFQYTQRHYETWPDQAKLDTLKVLLKHMAEVSEEKIKNFFCPKHGECHYFILPGTSLRTRLDIIEYMFEERKKYATADDQQALAYRSFWIEVKYSSAVSGPVLQFLYRQMNEPDQKKTLDDCKSHPELACVKQFLTSVSNASSDKTMLLSSSGENQLVSQSQDKSTLSLNN